MISDAKRAELDEIARIRSGGMSKNEPTPTEERHQMSDMHHDSEVVSLLKSIVHELRAIKHELQPQLPTSTRFTEITMLPTQGGNTLVFTGTFVPAGSVPPADAQYAVTSNDPAVLPTVDATGLIVTIPLPTGWVEGQTLVVTRTASSVSVPSWTLSDPITPSAPPSANLPTSTTFVQTT